MQVQIVKILHRLGKIFPILLICVRNLGFLEGRRISRVRLGIAPPSGRSSSLFLLRWILPYLQCDTTDCISIKIGKTAPVCPPSSFGNS
jgi:hypothetical protein